MTTNKIAEYAGIKLKCSHDIQKANDSLKKTVILTQFDTTSRDQLIDRVLFACYINKLAKRKSTYRQKKI